MIDSGANIDAADIDKHFPAYSKLVGCDIENDEAECASGNVVKGKGRVTVNGTMDGCETAICFKNMKIKSKNE